ncbi:hypothetical protein [Roseomonas sp. KE2513]|uniref:hypothetical protein n=1 Tax=Roseomonas sp. KE2513 TaxID=2479202 RepID=UPI0018E03A5F|nr:hypothetical protein [Roseomonas sp. KE2513]
MGRSSKALRPLAMVASLVVLAWFILPVLHATYTEGFEPSIGINALGLRSGQLQDIDLLYPFSGRFFLVTRLGSTAVIAGLGALDHLPTLVNFRLVMLASLVLLVGAVVYLLARVYRVPPAFGALACLLFPPIFESAYLFNDNVLSAGLTTLAIAVFWTRLSLPATAVAAVLMGLAAATRPDALFVLPAFAVLMWFELPSWRARFAHALLAAPLIALIPLGVYAAFGLNYLEIFSVASRAIALWDRQEGFVSLLRHAVYGLALPGMILLPLGLASFLAQRRWREVLLCILVPLIYLAAYGRSLYELRYLLPLAPFIAIAIVEGGRAVLRARGLPRMVLSAALAVAVLALLAPPVRVPSWQIARLGVDNDGPRPLIGRIWSPLIWTRWLDDLNGGIAAIDQAIERDAQGGPPKVFVSTYWNSDRLLDLLLLEHGFAPRHEGLPEACRSVAEVFARGGTTVLHVRTHLPFVPGQREAVNWQEGGLPCLRDAGLADATALVLGWRPAAHSPAGTGREEGVTEVFRPPGDIVPDWADPALRRQVYLIAQAPVAAVARYLNAPVTPAERKVAEDLFLARTRLLQ